MMKVIGILVALFAFDAMLWMNVLNANTEDVKLYFLDIGQGDSSLVMLPSAVQVLIDGGPPNGKAASELKKHMPFADRYIDIVAMTHPQLDHFGGLIEVLRTYDVGVFIATGREADIGAFTTLKEELRKKKINVVTLRAGDSIQSGSTSMQILGPTDKEMTSEELNDTSLIVRLTTKGLTALYTGDIGARGEERLMREENIKADVLKVAHHGSRFSSSANFLSAVKPKVAIIEVGKNSYGHPTKQALTRLEAIGATVFRTDLSGTIEVEKSGDTVRVSPGK